MSKQREPSYFKVLRACRYRPEIAHDGSITYAVCYPWWCISKKQRSRYRLNMAGRLIDAAIRCIDTFGKGAEYGGPV